MNIGIGNCSQQSGDRKGPARFDGGPPGNPDDTGNGGGGDDNNLNHSCRSIGQGRDPNHNNNRHRGYSVPAAIHPQYNTPGVMEAVEHHCNHMHECVMEQTFYYYLFFSLSYLLILSKHALI